jgi:chromosome segregation ATPase
MGISRWHRAFAIAALMLGASAAVPAAAKEGDVENRLRAALRQATLQLRTLEDQNAALQAKQAEFDRDKQDLTAKLDAAQKELDEQKAHGEADKQALRKSESDVKQTRATLDKWKAAYEDAANVARTRDADAKRLDMEVQRLDAEAKRRDAALTQTRDVKRACETKNAELYKLGLEMLDLYDNKPVLGNLLAHEPVTQLKRVEYENLMQDYEDKLRANELVPAAQ